MKVRVNRQLSSGVYHVNFDVSDFTPEEVSKMGSFGVPNVKLRWSGPTIGMVPLTQIAKKYDATFATEKEATEYAENVLAQIRNAMQYLRESQDKFSSSQEVEL